MLRSLALKISRADFHTRYANRNVKAFKFIPPPVKSNNQSKLPSLNKIDEATLELLEKLSLVGFGSTEGIEIVEGAITFANQIFEVNTDHVKPLVTVLEEETLYLREDIVDQDATTEEILSNSSATLENYFITPVGNIPYVPDKTIRTLPEQSKINSVSEKDQISLN